MSKNIKSHKLKLAVAGADGKMGQTIIRQALTNPSVEVVAALVLADSPWQHKKVSQLLGVDCALRFSDNYSAEIAKADVLIDFTRPAGTCEFINICQKLAKKIVIGTTGFDKEQSELIAQASKNIAIVKSSNMAPGVNVLFHLTQIAAKLLAKYDAEIFEMHHRHKVDAPSGTALSLYENILKGRGEFGKAGENDLAVFARSGHTGERKEGRVGFSVARGGDVVGEHTVMFLGEGEKLEIHHTSTTRSHYANGAISASLFLVDKPNGLYDMSQVLGLSL